MTPELLEEINNDPAFTDETQEEFDARMAQVKILFAELDAKFPKEKVFEHEKGTNNIKQIPELENFIDEVFPNPGRDFERRVVRYGE